MPPAIFTLRPWLNIVLRSIVHLRQQTRNNLHLFLAVLVLLALDLGSLCATLLLRLASFHPLLHGQVLPKLGQIVVLQAEAVEQGTVGDGVQDDLVVWSVMLSVILRRQ